MIPRGSADGNTDSNLEVVVDERELSIMRVFQGGDSSISNGEKSQDQNESDSQESQSNKIDCSLHD